ncbi:MAG TPA: FtsQ-type POTRA domain-containing protein [Steroidobacteraceae bacterium]|nr:FtsQ-type POTRA domain-containing protein [Steroidobacteraceae bacterium]
MSGLVRHRHPGRRALRIAAPILVLLGLSGTLAVALQVREVKVTGVVRFSAREVETVLRSALGTPTIVTRAERLRTAVLAIPWVAEATVKVSLDGVVSCTVSERQPAAFTRDGGELQLIDGQGNVLGPYGADLGLLRLDGFAPFPDERTHALAGLRPCELAWGGRVERIERLGPHDVALHFAGGGPSVLADPASPAALAIGREVLAAWPTTRLGAARQIDVRVPGRVAVLPAALPVAEAS